MEEKKKTIIYTSPACSYCLLLKEFLKKRNIEFEEINVLENPEKAEEMVKRTGQMGVPVVETPKGEVLIGFNQQELEKVFG
jgi:glutaredoxin-like YruB-family protein